MESEKGACPPPVSDDEEEEEGMSVAGSEMDTDNVRSTQSSPQ